MSKKRIMITGGSGLLGREIVKLDGSIMAPTHDEMDITSRDSVFAAFEKYSPEILLHLAAATKPPEHEKSPVPGLTVNIIGTANLALACNQYGVRMVYTSTDYVYTGPGPHSEQDPLLCPYKFAWSKLGGEAAVSLLQNSLVLRLSFGPVPYPWEKVYDGQTNSKLYVDEIAPLVLAAALTSTTGIMNVGGPRNTLLDYARRTKRDIETIPKPEWAPVDTSLDIAKMKRELGIENEEGLLKH